MVADRQVFQGHRDGMVPWEGRQFWAGPYSILMSAAFTTSAHFVISPRRKAASSSGVELRASAPDIGPDSRKIALARALVVRSYLMDKGVKSRIEVGSFSGDGDSVDILVPST